jgi:hypothetical protein
MHLHDRAGSQQQQGQQGGTHGAASYPVFQPSRNEKRSPPALGALARSTP